MLSVHCTLDTVYNMYSVHGVRCTVYGVHCTVYSVHSTLVKRTRKDCDL